jgi:fructose-bisphosphate aldolase class II
LNAVFIVIFKKSVKLGVLSVKFVNMKEMLQKAYEGHYAVGAFNANNMEIVQAITQGCQEEHSPVILQVSPGARKYAGHTYLLKIIEAAAQETDIPLALHLDHGDSFELCKACIDGGFSSVMIDGSHYEYEKNIEITKKVVDYARKYNVTVEGELGRLSGMEDESGVSGNDSHYTNPAQVEDFVKKTGVDALAIAIGTSHGACKFKPGFTPSLRFDILEKIQDCLPNFPIVLHGSSSICGEFIEKINEHGGNLTQTVGIPEKLLKKAVGMSVCKINVDSDLRLAMTLAIREHMVKYPAHFDPRQYLANARDAVKELVRYKVREVFKSSGKAS